MITQVTILASLKRILAIGVIIALAVVSVPSRGFTQLILPTTAFITSACSVKANTKSCLSAQQHDVSMPTPVWYQHEISITAPSRGCHLVTDQIHKAIRNDIGNIKIGMANLFIQHTSASLTINENADPSVRSDMEKALNKIVPASWNHDGTFTHTMEGKFSGI